MNITDFDKNDRWQAILFGGISFFILSVIIQNISGLFFIVFPSVFSLFSIPVSIGYYLAYNEKAGIDSPLMWSIIFIVFFTFLVFDFNLLGFDFNLQETTKSTPIGWILSLYDF